MVCWLFSKWTVSKKSFRIIIRVSNGLILVLIWVQTVYKGYQQRTKVATSKDRVEKKFVLCEIQFFNEKEVLLNIHFNFQFSHLCTAYQAMRLSAVCPDHTHLLLWRNTPPFWTIENWKNTYTKPPWFCLIWFFTSHQQSFSYKGTGLPGLNQY